MFEISDLCLAKFGKSVWPAQIIKMKSDGNKCSVYFYGTHNRGEVSVKSLIKYDETTLKENIPYFLIGRNKKLELAVWELKNDPDSVLKIKDKEKIMKLESKIKELEEIASICSEKMNRNIYCTVNVEKLGALPGEITQTDQSSIGSMKCKDWNANCQLYDSIKQKILSLKEKIENIRLNTLNESFSIEKQREKNKFEIGDLVFVRNGKKKTYLLSRIIDLSSNNYEVYIYNQKCKVILNKKRLSKFYKAKIINMLKTNPSRDLLDAIEEIQNDEDVSDKLRDLFKKIKLPDISREQKATKALKSLSTRRLTTNSCDTIDSIITKTTVTTSEIENIQNEICNLKEEKSKKEKEFLKTINEFNLKIENLEKRLSDLKNDQQSSNEDMSGFDENDDESDEESEYHVDLDRPDWCRPEEIKKKLDMQLSSKTNLNDLYGASRHDSIDIDKIFENFIS